MDFKDTRINSPEGFYTNFTIENLLKSGDDNEIDVETVGEDERSSITSSYSEPIQSLNVSTTEGIDSGIDSSCPPTSSISERSSSRGENDVVSIDMSEREEYQIYERFNTPLKTRYHGRTKPENINKPFCARCQNHKRYVLKEGHKKFCPRKECICPLCNQNKVLSDGRKKGAHDEGDFNDKAKAEARKELKYLVKLFLNSVDLNKNEKLKIEQIIKSKAKIEAVFPKYLTLAVLFTAGKYEELTTNKIHCLLAQNNMNASLPKPKSTDITLGSTHHPDNKFSNAQTAKSLLMVQSTVNPFNNSFPSTSTQPLPNFSYDARSHHNPYEHRHLYQHSNSLLPDLHECQPDDSELHSQHLPLPIIHHRTDAHLSRQICIDLSLDRRELMSINHNTERFFRTDIPNQDRYHQIGHHYWNDARIEHGLLHSSSNNADPLDLSANNAMMNQLNHELKKQH